MRVVRKTFSFTVAANTDWVISTETIPVSAGYIVDATYRLATAGATNGDLELKVVDGAYDASALTTATFAAIPDDDVVYNETGIALVASDTTGVDTNVYSSVGEAAAFEGRRPSALGEQQNPSPSRSPVVAVRGDGVLVGSVTVTLRCRVSR